jgi:hypothetical protein
MRTHRLTSLPLLLIAAGGLVVGLAVPATARETSHLINGSTIKKGSIAGNRLKPNTLTGKEINESTLGTVPLANRAKAAPLPSSLPSGQTETGGWEFGLGPAGPVNAMISFPVPVNGTLAYHIIDTTKNPPDTDPTGCTGTPSAPAAMPGNFCVFVGAEYNGPGITTGGVINPLTGSEGSVSRFGAVVFGTSTNNLTIAGGSWAVTAR